MSFIVGKLKRLLTVEEAFEVLEIWKYRPVLYEKDQEIFNEDRLEYTKIVNNILDDLNKEDHTMFDKLLDEFCDNNLSFTLVDKTLYYLKNKGLLGD